MSGKKNEEKKRARKEEKEGDRERERKENEKTHKKERSNTVEGDNREKRMTAAKTVVIVMYIHRTSKPSTCLSRQQQQ